MLILIADTIYRVDTIAVQFDSRIPVVSIAAFSSNTLTFAPNSTQIPHFVQ